MYRKQPPGLDYGGFLVYSNIPLMKFPLLLMGVITRLPDYLNCLCSAEPLKDYLTKGS